MNLSRFQELVSEYSDKRRELDQQERGGGAESSVVETQKCNILQQLVADLNFEVDILMSQIEDDEVRLESLKHQYEDGNDVSGGRDDQEASSVTDFSRLKQMREDLNDLYTHQLAVLLEAEESGDIVTHEKLPLLENHVEDLKEQYTSLLPVAFAYENEIVTHELKQQSKTNKSVDTGDSTDPKLQNNYYTVGNYRDFEHQRDNQGDGELQVNPSYSRRDWALKKRLYYDTDYGGLVKADSAGKILDADKSTCGGCKFRVVSQIGKKDVDTQINISQLDTSNSRPTSNTSRELSRRGSSLSRPGRYDSPIDRSIPGSCSGCPPQKRNAANNTTISLDSELAAYRHKQKVQKFINQHILKID